MTRPPSVTGRSRAPLSQRVVERAADRVASPEMTRRSFLARTAVVASALAVNPFDFVFKPVSAYAAVCGDAASCSSGWSAFCCTVNVGANTCPPGSYAAGWWKVDDSAFCRGGARYYIDCNRSPGSSCRCRCADGPCDKRRTCCNVFRYGQCNQHVAGVTEVVCRIVTCMAPWEWDPSCTTTVRRDDNTAGHSASCLPGRWPSPIEIRYLDLGLTGSILGLPAGDEHAGARGGLVRRYQHGLILWHPDTGAVEVVGVMARAYDELTREKSPLGYPVAPVEVYSGGRRVQRFERGVIVRRPDLGAFALWGAILAAYEATGGLGGRLGYPVEHQLRLPDGDERASFEHGAIELDRATGRTTISLRRGRRRANGQPPASPPTRRQPRDFDP